MTTGRGIGPSSDPDGLSPVRLRGGTLPTIREVSAGLGAVVAIALLVSLGAVPIAEDVQTNETVTRQHDVGVDTPVYGALRATLDDATTLGTPNATLTIEDNRTGQTTTLTIDESATQGTTLNDVPIEITIDSVNSNSSATVTYDLASDAYLPDIAQDAVTVLLTLLFVAVVLLALVIVGASV